MSTPSRIKHLFFWLSGAGAESLEECPDWEQRKHVAFGATVLVPTVFAIIACAYALSTLTENWKVIVPVSLAWGFIIMTIDRALLTIYRSYQSFFRKIGQFFLRIVVAALMGITISHPLTLLLFQDTIHGAIEEERQGEIEAARAVANGEKAAVEAKIAALEEEIAEQRTRFDETFTAEFVAADESAGALDPSSDMDEEMRAEMEARIESDTAAETARIAAIDKEFEELQAKYTTLQSELDHWQREFEREVNGQRSGIVGLGPRAKSIRDDQLAWRREEAKRIGQSLESLTSQRQALSESIDATAAAVEAEFTGIAAERAERIKTERERVAKLRQDVQKRQADQFVDQQNAIRSTITSQIDTRLAEMARLQEEIAAVNGSAEERVAAIAAEPRRDILTQTLALHGLFLGGSEGGHFALAAYLVLAGLFLLIDTIPLVVKFFSQPGPYDALVDCEEVRYARDRKAYLHSHARYMDQLSEGQLMQLTRNKPLQQALIDGVDHSRAAKAFVEKLIELESSFDEKVAAEQARLAEEKDASQRDRVQRLERFAEAFYDDLDQRMEGFFDRKAARKAAKGMA